jgi:hypothetical protein
MICLWSNLMRHWSCCASTQTVITKKKRNRDLFELEMILHSM